MSTIQSGTSHFSLWYSWYSRVLSHCSVAFGTRGTLECSFVPAFGTRRSCDSSVFSGFGTRRTRASTHRLHFRYTRGTREYRHFRFWCLWRVGLVNTQSFRLSVLLVCLCEFSVFSVLVLVRPASTLFFQFFSTHGTLEYSVMLA